MTTQRRPSERIIEAVTSWPEVTAGPGERGEFAFKLGRREIGHLHGDRVAHFGFPKEIGADLREQGRVGPHPVRPDFPGWAARAIEDENDVDDVIALMRLNYDRIVARFGSLRRQPRPPRRQLVAQIYADAAELDGVVNFLARNGISESDC